MKNSCNLLYLDCFSGLSGDMIISALLDVGVPVSVIEEAAISLDLGGYRIRVEKETRQSMAVTRFFVDVTEDQPSRHFSDIRRMIEQSSLPADVAELALAIFTNLAEAEAHVHGTSIDKVHFHEVGAVDSIVDIVAAAAAIVHLGVQVVCAPIPIGKGFVKTQHGMLPLPAPATLHLLAGVPCVGTEIESELTTPTGAAIVKTVAAHFGSYPAMIPVKVGMGAGARSHETRPGILRAVLGSSGAGTNPSKGAPSCFVIEANIDDMTGEVASASRDSLLEQGALDVWFESIQMKKGRPALKMCVLSRHDDLEKVTAKLFAETPTIGMRYYPVGRMEMKRSIETVETPYGKIQVKIARGLGGSANAAPEFEDCKRAALEHNVPLKQVMSIASGLAQKFLL